MRGDHDSATGEESGDDELAQSMSQRKLADTVDVSGVEQAARSQKQSSENELRQGSTQSQRCTTNTTAAQIWHLFRKYHLKTIWDWVVFLLSGTHLICHTITYLIFIAFMMLYIAVRISQLVTTPAIFMKNI